MSVVAPASAVLAAALPAVAGLFGGETLPVSGRVGLVVGVLAIGLVSATTTPGPTTGPGAVRYAWGPVRFGTLSRAGFALLFIDRAGTQAGAWPVLPSQTVALALILALAIHARSSAKTVLAPGSPSWPSSPELLELRQPCCFSSRLAPGS